MIKSGCLRIGILGILFCFASPAFTQESTPVLQTIGQEPYSYLVDDNRYEGYHYEIANSILKQAGYKVTAEPPPLKRLIHNLKEGHSDCILAANSPFARKHFIAVEEIGHNLQVGILPREGINPSEYEDLQGLAIAVPQGMTIGEPFDSDTSLIKVSTPDYNQSSLMLKHNRIDAIMGALESIRFSAYKVLPNEQPRYGTPLIIQSLPVALICNKDKIDTEIVKRLKTATQELKANGTIEKIISNFFANLFAS
ncbi:transporter substrate-binding domain-containing protein [Sneathiella sp. P13V-1]|uniref:substrate-binding periplasmic protein n=1 Tax=Sneathiella sp. P13V-1 TaxID=2697366 RepID=UPI00187BA275|nr:transporter substrate-binding domain-containing protein [Sneathiella sp. P13V-1]MBE7637902.1 transporter substrate-binding domain-containing protein [Sneathiella sp. P13V-1]